MSISSLYVGNFKGVAQARWVPLRPLTVFVGPNSSGKSTCLHALACLSQTVKLPNNRRPLSLDDEYASVHLGRFIEVAHSRSYDDAITLGIEVPGASYTTTAIKPEKFAFVRGDLQATYNFKCTQDTQAMYLDSSTMKIDNETISVSRSGERYQAVDVRTGRSATFEQFEGFFLRLYHGGKGPADFEAFVNMQMAVQALQDHVQNALQNTLYLGPFRQSPQRRYPTRGTSPLEVGAQGEAAVTMLANESVESRKRPRIQQVGEWLGVLGLGNEVGLERLGASDLFGVNVTLRDGSAFPIADLGYGMSQVLPVLVQCSFAEPGSTLLFEQPEIHLHTASAKPLANVFAETANRGVGVVIETHSPQLVWAVVNAIRAGKIQRSDVAVYRVARDGGSSCLTELPIEEDLDIYGNWETGIA